MEDRGRDASQELTEVRTVLSRAESAIERIERYKESPSNLVTFDDHRYGGNGGYDPDADDMIRALHVVIDVLDRWRKTGPAKRWI